MVLKEVRVLPDYLHMGSFSQITLNYEPLVQAILT